MNYYDPETNEQFNIEGKTKTMFKDGELITYQDGKAFINPKTGNALKRIEPDEIIPISIVTDTKVRT